MAPPRVLLRPALGAAALVLFWTASPWASPDVPRPAGPAGPQPFNGAPSVIPAPDRSAIEEELSAVMSMTPPDRTVLAELPSGSRLWIRAGAYEPGPSGSDCRRFGYEYEAIDGGTATVAGMRCTPSSALTWLPLAPDTLLEARGFPLPPPPPAQPVPEAAASPPRPVEEIRPPAPAAPLPPRQAAPPSRVILPFTPAR